MPSDSSVLRRRGWRSWPTLAAPVVLLAACEPSPYTAASFSDSLVELAATDTSLDYVVVHLSLLRPFGADPSNDDIQWEDSRNPWAFGVTGMGDSGLVYAVEHETRDPEDSARIRGSGIEAGFRVDVKTTRAPRHIACDSTPSMHQVGTTIHSAITTSDCPVLRELILRFGDNYDYTTSALLTRFTVRADPTSWTGKGGKPMRLDVQPLRPFTGIGWNGLKDSRDSVTVRALAPPGLKRLRIEETYGRMASYSLTTRLDPGTEDCAPIIVTAPVSTNLALPEPSHCGVANYQLFLIELPPGTEGRFRFISTDFGINMRVVSLGGTAIPYDLTRSSTLSGDSIEIWYPPLTMSVDDGSLVGIELRRNAGASGNYRVVFDVFPRP